MGGQGGREGVSGGRRGHGGPLAKEDGPGFPTLFNDLFLFFVFCLSHVFVCLKVQRTRMQR